MKSGDARVALIGFPSVGKVFQTHVLSVFFTETIASYDFLLFCVKSLSLSSSH